VNEIVWILLAVMFLAGVLVGMLALLVAGIRSDDRRRHIHRGPCSRAEHASRRLLVGIREPSSDADDGEEC
jgi:hypothetical protein